MGVLAVLNAFLDGDGATLLQDVYTTHNRQPHLQPAEEAPHRPSTSALAVCVMAGIGAGDPDSLAVPPHVRAALLASASERLDTQLAELLRQQGSILGRPQDACAAVLAGALVLGAVGRVAAAEQQPGLLQCAANWLSGAARVMDAALSEVAAAGPAAALPGSSSSGSAAVQPHLLSAVLHFNVPLRILQVVLGCWGGVVCVHACVKGAGRERREMALTLRTHHVPTFSSHMHSSTHHARVPCCRWCWLLV